MSIDILFICPTLEPGNCGVADFTLTLATKLSSMGITCACLAVHDHHIGPSPDSSVKSSIFGNIDILRISAKYSWNLKSTLVQSQLDLLKPEWISLQYVPYAYSYKGLPFAFLRVLCSLKTSAKWQITAHELWVDPRQSFRFKILSSLQVLIFKRLWKRLRPTVVHVSNRFFQQRLDRLMINSSILPVFSNIPFCPISLPLPQSDSTWRFVLFGSINREWSPFKLLEKIEEARSIHGIDSCHFVSVGKMDSYGAALWDSLVSLPYPAFSFSRLGMLPFALLSAELQYADFGICVTPDVLVEKSGSVSAMLAHGLPIIICRLSNDCESWHQELQDRGSYVLLNSSFADNIYVSKKYEPINLLDEAASILVESLGLNSVSS